jgi:pimeloyl-ACP methyl ester carboxylesterase
VPPRVEDVDGWPLGDTLRAELQVLNLNDLPPLPATLNLQVLQVGPREQIAVPLQKWCEARRLTSQAVVMQPFWNLLDYTRATPLFEAMVHNDVATNDAAASTPPAVSLQKPTNETALLWQSPRGKLVGVVHAAQSTLDGTKTRGTVVMLHGWSGYRSGPHQMLTRAAREFARCGYNVVRFDFSGRGDSEGDAATATLATMADDARVVLRWCREEFDSPLLMLGLCSGCEVAVALSGEKVDGLALWSAPVFAAQSSAARDSKKRLHYVKLLSGRVDTKAVKQVVSSTGGEGKNIESGAVGQLPKGFRATSVRSLHQLRVPILLTYGTADPTTGEALSWYREQWSQAPEQLHVYLVEGANHSYYGLGWEREVIDTTRQWLQKYF